MTQSLRAGIAVSEDPDLVPSTHTEQFTIYL